MLGTKILAIAWNQLGHIMNDEHTAPALLLGRYLFSAFALFASLFYLCCLCLSLSVSLLSLPLLPLSSFLALCLSVFALSASLSLSLAL